MFNFDTFENGRTYFASFAIHTKHAGNIPSDVIDLIGAFDDVKDVESFCAAIVRNFALTHDLSVDDFAKDTIMNVERHNDRYVIVSYYFTTDNDSPLGAIYNTLEIYFAL